MELPYAKEYQIFSFLLTRAKNLKDIQGINNLTCPWFYIYYAYRKLAIFISSYEYEENHAVPNTQ
jgi:hypothetical protein